MERTKGFQLSRQNMFYPFNLFSKKLEIERQRRIIYLQLFVFQGRLSAFSNMWVCQMLIRNVSYLKCCARSSDVLVNYSF